MELQQLEGTIERLVFHNQDTGFVVFRLHVRQELITVKATAAGITAGQQVELYGSWIMHPKFGKQFEAEKCILRVPTSSTGIIKYLSSGMIKGIGPVYAKKLVDYFGDQTLDIIDKHPEQLTKVSGIGHKRIEQIITAWQQHKQISKVMVFLQDKGISPTYATKIYKQYGDNAIALITENPYRLADDIWGIGFKMADAIAQQLGFTTNSLKRIRAGIIFALTTALQDGHLYQELEKLRTSTRELLELDPTVAENSIKTALHDLHTDRKIVVLTENEIHYVALSSSYNTEMNVAQKVKASLEYPSLKSFDTDNIYTQLRTESETSQISLNDDQQRGIMACLTNKMTIITGGPGTGKTTLIKQLLSILDEHNIIYKLAAPTGRAAQRMMQSTNRFASTIHRLLEFDVSTMAFTKNEQNALPIDFLIIDEASMIDIFLMRSILRAVPLTAHVVLIGDIDQLPSVGAGNALNDLIASNIVATVQLKHIFRQAQGSLIVINAHRINEGQFPLPYSDDAKKDFIFIKEEDPTHIKDHLASIYADGLKRWGISAHDTIVLSPMNKGSVGTQRINHDLQSILNAQETVHIQSGATHYRVHDRVIQLKNNYDKSVFNGDIGTIISLDTAEQMLTVQFGERIIEYEHNELDELSLAYAITIHKSQGSEFSAVIIPLFMHHFTLLQRNLLYTAVTRAKKLCILIGQPRAIGMAVNNISSIQRCTFLQKFLTTNLTAR